MKFPFNFCRQIFITFVFVLLNASKASHASVAPSLLDKSNEIVESFQRKNGRIRDGCPHTLDTPQPEVCTDETIPKNAAFSTCLMKEQQAKKGMVTLTGRTSTFPTLNSGAYHRKKKDFKECGPCAVYSKAFISEHQREKARENNCKVGRYVFVVLIASWKRWALQEIVLSSLFQLRERLLPCIELRVWFGVSEGATADAIIKRYGFNYVNVPNHPLGLKYNSMGNYVFNHEKNYHGVIIHGSDDLLNESVFRIYVDWYKRMVMIGGFRDFFSADVIHGNILYGQYYGTVDSHESIGHGRFIHEKVWKAMKGRLWKDTLVRRLDGYSGRNIFSYIKSHPDKFGKDELEATNSASINCAPSNCMPVLVMKSSSNLNSFSAYISSQSLNTCILIEDGKGRSSEQMERFLDLTIGRLMSNMLISLRLILERTNQGVDNAFVALGSYEDDVLRIDHDWSSKDSEIYFGKRCAIYIGNAGVQMRYGNKEIYSVSSILKTFRAHNLMKSLSKLVKPIGELGDLGIRINYLIPTSKQVIAKLKITRFDMLRLKTLISRGLKIDVHTGTSSFLVRIGKVVRDRRKKTFFVTNHIFVQLSRDRTVYYITEHMIKLSAVQKSGYLLLRATISWVDEESGEDSHEYKPEPFFQTELDEDRFFGLQQAPFIIGLLFLTWIICKKMKCWRSRKRKAKELEV